MAGKTRESQERQDLQELKRDFQRRFGETAGTDCPGRLCLAEGRWQFLPHPLYSLEHYSLLKPPQNYADELFGPPLQEQRSYIDERNREIVERTEQLQAILDELNADWTKALENISKNGQRHIALSEVIRSDDLLAYEGEGPQVIIGDLLCKGWIALLAGASKSYKSWLSLQLALAVSNGGRWLGFTCVPRKVLCVDYELSHHSLRSRLKTLQKAYDGPTHGPDFLVMRDVSTRRKSVDEGPHQNGNGLHRRERQVDLILRKIDESYGRVDHVYDLIILDPLYMFLEGRDENNAAAMVEVFNDIRELRRRTGAAILINAH